MMQLNPKKTLFFIWILFVLSLTNSQVYSQNNCPFIWPIDGGECSNCAPGGWTNILTSDIVDGISWFVCDLDGYGQSPTGGNSVLLYGTNNNAEAISTIVGGLTPGVIYNIGFYWTQAYTACPGGINFGGGDLIITIDGNEYAFSGAEDWELAEICYEAENYVAEIHITMETDSPGVVLVDSAICDELETCCELKVDVNNNMTLCPGDVFEFDGSYSGEQGNVVVEWTSEPEDGIDYLDDPFSLTPIFEYPASTDFFGESYRFKLTVIDAACDREEDFLLVVSPSVIPEFEFELCEVFTDFELPTTSLDPYTGEWEGNFDFANLGGTFQEYTFILDDGQDNCVESHVYELYIAEAEPVIFDLPEVYCGLDPESYYIEFTSDNGVVGNWDIDGIFPDEMTYDFNTYTFVPDPEEHCAYNYEYTFEISEPDSLTFNIPTTFCIVQDNYSLPTISLEGIQGEWNVSEIDVSIVGTNFMVTFTPEDVQDCYFPYVHIYDVTTNIQNSFSLPSSICSNIGEVQFATISDQGYDGTWSPSAINFDTINDNSVLLNWQPLPGQSDCLVPSPQIINVDEAEVLNFDLPLEICMMQPSFLLPLNNFEGTISGQWNIVGVNPNLLGIGDHEFEFIPDDIYCAENYTYTVSIIEEFQPQFNLVTGFCSSQPQITLPTISDDGYIGSWTIPLIDPSQAGTTSIQSTFIPDPGQANCLISFTETFEVDLLIDPSFDLPQIICSDNLPYTLPLVSNNGVQGIWNITTIDNSNTEQVLNLVFTPNDLSCYNLINTSIEIVQLDLLSIDITNTTDCNAIDGIVSINNPLLNFEYSIDNGLSWQMNNEFDGLEFGNYRVLARSNILQSCVQEFDFSIVDPDQILITDSEVINVSNCTIDNGSIEVFVNLIDAEYSIDNGVSWQSNNIFDNLTPGEFSVLARNASGVSCQDTVLVAIEAFPFTQIQMVDSENVSECEVDNGSINILSAVGQNLEYSINALDWQQQTLFENLGVGTFMLYARSSDSPDCIDSLSIELLGPDFPVIINVEVQNTNDCKASDGAIEIEASGVLLEYSIDGGQTWQSDALFETLSADTYDVVVREFRTLTCLIETEATINDPESFVLENIDVENVTTCFPKSGSLNILATSNFELEYSIDEGMTWQSESVFENLESGQIDVFIRPVAYINCEQSQQVTIELLPQEIELTEVILSQPSDCVTIDASIEFQTDITDLEYSIDNGQNWQINNVFLNIPDGQYTAIIRKPNATGCEIEYEFVIETPPCPCNDLLVDVGVGHVTCENPNSGLLEILEVNGLFTNHDIGVIWSNGNDEFANPMLSSGWYSYTINYDQNCLWTDSVFVEDFDPITFGLLSFDKTCTDEGQIEVVDFMGGNGEFNFSLDTEIFQEESVFYNLDPDQYAVYVMDQLGCQEGQNITLNSNLDLSLELQSIDPIIINQSTFLNPLINQTTIDSFQWTPELHILNPGELVANVAPRETTEYTLTIYYGECVETRSVEVQVIDNRKFYVGNILSLSENGNNIFFIQGGEDLELTVHNFSIFDRWGNKLFAKENVPLNDKSFGWDGNYNGQPVNVGVYTYYVNYTLRGRVYNDAGTLTLIR